jgi:raffinose/stachyose/melibiose transport system permease protein
MSEKQEPTPGPAPGSSRSASGRPRRLGLFDRRRRGGPRQVPWVWVLPAAILAFLIHYLAIGAGAWYAFTDWNGLTTHANYVGLANFREAFHDPIVRGALLHTLYLTAAFVVTVNALGLGLALALNRTVKSRNILRALFFAPIVMSPLAVSFIWQFIFDYSGPLNKGLSTAGLGSWRHTWLGDPHWALWAVWVLLVWQFAGLTMIMYLAGLQGIPPELDEACAVDGATTWRRFRRVTLPLLAPATTVAVTFTLILGLRVFDQVIALTNGGPVDATETLTTQVYKQAFVNGRYGYGASVALILTVLIAAAAFAQLAVLRRRETVL